MFEKGKYGIVDIIGVTLVVVAIISAGGIYYTASTYSRISDTLTAANVMVTDFNITHSEDAGTYEFLTSIMAINPSSLDIEIYSVEFNIYAYPSEAFGLDQSHYMGTGQGIQGGNSTIGQDSANYIYQHLTTTSTDIEANVVNGASFIGISGFVLFKIVDYPEVTKKVYFGFWNWVSIYES
jgi:hypothetical protein